MFGRSNDISIKKGLKYGHNLSPLPFHCALEYPVMKVEINAKSFRLGGAHQLFVDANDGNMFGGSVRAVNKALVVASKKISLEVKVGRAKIHGHVS